MRKEFLLIVLLGLTACGTPSPTPNPTPATTVATQGRPNHDIRQLNEAFLNVLDSSWLPPTDMPTTGIARYYGQVVLPKFFSNASVTGELGAMVDFDNETVVMTSGNFASYSDETNTFTRNLDGGLSMSDGTFSQGVQNGRTIPGFVGTISGAVNGSAVNANMRGGFVGEGRPQGFAALSYGDSSHQVQIHVFE